MHIKPTPPARRTSHPAFLVPGILINCTDRKPLSLVWVGESFSSSPLAPIAAEMRMHVDVAFLQHRSVPSRWLSGRERVLYGDEAKERGGCRAFKIQGFPTALVCFSYQMLLLCIQPLLPCCPLRCE